MDGDPAKLGTPGMSFRQRKAAAGCRFCVQVPRTDSAHFDCLEFLCPLDAAAELGSAVVLVIPRLLRAVTVRSVEFPPQLTAAETYQ